MNYYKIPEIKTEAELTQFLDQFSNHLKMKVEKISKLSFTKLVEKRKIPELNDLESELTELILNPAFKDLIYNWSDQVLNSLLKQRLVCWKNHLLVASVNRNPEIRNLTLTLSDKMITHKYQVRDEISSLGEIKDILRNSPDPSLRQDAWYAKHVLSETLAQDLIKLIKLRNSLAEEHGFKTYADLILKIEGYSLSDVREILLDLTKTTNPIYNQILKDGQETLGLAKIEPWDLMYLLHNMGGIDTALFPKNLLEAKLSKWGNDHGANLKKLGIELVYTDIPYNGLCFTLKEKEIKILSNPADGHSSYSTMFHELGHALHSAYNQQKAFIFSHEGGIIAEGMAELIGYITHHPLWLNEMGVDSEKIPSVQRTLIAPWFHYLRERTTYALAEYLIYENPEKDQDSILAEYEHNILGTTYTNAPRWAANSWYINYPIYWQNYVLADVVASQIHQTLNRKYGGLHRHPEALEEIREIYYAPGATIDWQEKLLNHTGSKLKANALAQDLEVYLTK